MDKFRDAYQEACKELPTPSMDVAKIQDGLSHQRLMRKRRRYMITRGCTAAAVFLLCGAGTVAAKNYRNSIIAVGDEGFTITSVRNTEFQEKNPGPQDYEPDVASFMKMGGVFSIEEDIPETGDILEEGSIPEMGNSSEKKKELGERNRSGEGERSTEQDAGDGYYVEYFMEDNCREYDSIEAFRDTEKLTAVIPDIALFGEEFTCEEVQVLEDGWHIMVRLSNEDVCFFMSQMDNSDCLSYSSSTSYGGRSVNERSFSNEQGLSYVMFDTVDDEGQVISVHAVISVNGWDLSMTFEGFEESIVNKILMTTDLSVYF